MVSQAIFGASVVLVEEKSAWVKVRTPDDYTGWMLLSALRRYGPDDHAYASTEESRKWTTLLPMSTANRM